MKKVWSKKILLLVLAVILAATAIAGCAGTNTSQTTYQTTSTTATGSTTTAVEKRNELVVGISADPSTLDPMVQSGQATRLIKSNIYRGLLAYQVDGKIGNEIAESYSIADDNITYTFKIRANAKFHDGSDITAEDVKFSIERILDEKVGATFRADFLKVIDKCEVVDPKTVKIILKAPDSTLP